MTIRGAWADIFWFSLFHELGHIVNGDIGRTAKFLDDGTDRKKEKKAENLSVAFAKTQRLCLIL